MRAEYILDRLYVHYSANKYLIDGVYLFGWESDFLSMSGSGYLVEVEIKTSYSDYVRDFKKDRSGKLSRGFGFYPEVRGESYRWVRGVGGILEKRMLGMSPLVYKRHLIPNRFLYCFPDEDWARRIEVPVYSGKLLCDEGRGRLLEVVKAPLLHRNKLFGELQTRLLDKFYYLSLRQRADIRRMSLVINNKKE